MSDFSPCHVVKRIGAGISMALMQISQHFMKTKWPPRKFEASGCPENTFSHILHDLSYILHSPKPLLFAFFSSQHQSANIEQKSTKSLHFIGFSSAVHGRGISIDLGIGKCAYILAEKGANLRAIALNPSEICTHETIGQHLRG